MLSTSLRLVLASLCVAAIAVTPALAGDGQNGPGNIGGSNNETPTSWFVQFSSPPGADGTSKSKLKGEHDDFESNAKADGIKLKENYSYDTLFNGVSVSVRPSEVAALAGLPGVTAVYPVHTVSLPRESVGGPSIDLKNAVGLTQASQARDLGLDGSGVTIAIMDSGVDYTLPELGGCFGPGCKVRGGFDLVGDTYNADDTSNAYQPVPQPDRDPAPCDPNFSDAQEAAGAGTSNSAHGTHVAGIAAADGRGHEADGQVVGVAPGAKLLAYKVFGCNGSTSSDVIIHAMEMALDAHADVLNISIGSAFGNWPQSPEAIAADNLVNQGMVVVASIGNSGANGGQLWSAGSPGIARKVIGVASFDNTKATLPTFRVGGKPYTYTRASGAPPAPTSGGGIIAFTGSPASTSDACAALPDGSLAGKIAFVRRGGCSFAEKAANAQTAGASAIVLYNNQSGLLAPTVAGAGVTVPVMLIAQADGNAIYAGRATASTLAWTNVNQETPVPTAGRISDFSAWGTDAELTLKPDIGGPGGWIYSTWPHQQFGGHNTLGGTSMAAPHVAGLAALILQAKRGSSQTQDQNQRGNNNDDNRRGSNDGNVSPALVQTLLMNTALPKGLNVAPAAGLEPTWRQGAGLAQVVDAVTTPAFVTPAKISLGDGNGGRARLTVANSGRKPITYDLSEVSTVGTGPATAAGAVYPFNFSYLVNANAASFSSASVTVPAGGRASVDVTIAAGPWPDRSLYGGYVVLTPRGSGVTLRVPYVGLKGDYQSLPVLTAADCGLPAVFKLDDAAADDCLGGGVQRLGAAGASFTLQGSDVPILLYHLNHQVRRLNIQIYKANGSPVHPVFNFATQLDYLPRNSTATAFFEFDWDGTRAHGNGGDRRKVVPNGTYVLKVSALKALGNPGNPADWETYTTPPITLARP